MAKWLYDLICTAQSQFIHHNYSYTLIIIPSEAILLSQYNLYNDTLLNIYCWFIKHGTHMQTALNLIPERSLSKKLHFLLKVYHSPLALKTLGVSLQHYAWSLFQTVKSATISTKMQKHVALKWLQKGHLFIIWELGTSNGTVCASQLKIFATLSMSWNDREKTMTTEVGLQINFSKEVQIWNTRIMMINSNCPYQFKSRKKILDFLIDKTAELKLIFFSFSDFFFFRFCTFHALKNKIRNMLTGIQFFI